MTAAELFAPGARVVFLHAHPDDETLATGVLIADLVASGHPVAVVTATRGERGEIRPGLDVGADIVAHREGELDAALAAGPAAPSWAKRWKSTCSPSIGVWSILKSPVWMMTPCGVVIASAAQSGILCVTRRNSIEKGPTSTRSRGRTLTSRSL